MKKIYVAFILPLTSFSAFSDSNFAGEILFGSAKQKVQESVIESGHSSSYGFRAFYNFSQHISALIEYKNFGGAKNKYKEPYEPLVWNIEVKSVNFGMRGALPLSENFSATAEVGYSAWDMDIDVRSNEITGAFSDDGNDLYYRTGINYQINGKYTLGIEYSIFNMKLANGKHKVNDISMSIGMRF